MSPLCWSVWGDPLEDGFRRTMYAIGVLAKREVVVAPDPQEHLSSPIYGRRAFNIDVLRAVMSRISAKVADEFEHDMLGTVRPDAPAFPVMPQRLPAIAVKLPYTMLRTARLLQRNYAETKAWWRNEVLAIHRGTALPRRSALEDLEASRALFTRSFFLHTLVRYQLAGVQGIVSKIAEKIGKPELGIAALAAQGGVAETLLADDVWRMARAEFGVQEFIDEHGFHGPSEGNVYTRSWGEQPDRVEAMAREPRPNAAKRSDRCNGRKRPPLKPAPRLTNSLLPRPEPTAASSVSDFGQVAHDFGGSGWCRSVVLVGR